MKKEKFMKMMEKQVIRNLDREAFADNALYFDYGLLHDKESMKLSLCLTHNSQSVMAFYFHDDYRALKKAAKNGKNDEISVLTAIKNKTEDIARTISDGIKALDSRMYEDIQGLMGNSQMEL